MSNNRSSHTDENNFLVQDAIDEGMKLAEKVSESNQQVTVNFTRSELEKMEELISSLNLSQTTLLESAIGYIYRLFSFDQKAIKKIIEDDSQTYKVELEKIKLEKLPRKESDKFTTKIELSVPIANQVKEIGMIDKVSECIFTGVNLLYKQLIEDVKKFIKQK